MAGHASIQFLSVLLLLISNLNVRVEASRLGSMGTLQMRYRHLQSLGLALDHPLHALPLPDEDGIQTEYATLPIDHFAKGTGKEAGTFQNRFWVSNSTYKSGAPIFIIDSGEGDAGPFAIKQLTGRSTFRRIVADFQGMAIFWEHRYYGQSLPFPVNKSTPASQMQYLTTAQALADVKAFAANFSRSEYPNANLTPSAVPWVFLGGSYPGVRATLMRQWFPDTIYAAYASSAPVEARVDMTAYFDPIHRGMLALGYGNCTKDITAAVQEMDRQMADEKASAALKTKFFGLGAAASSNGGFANTLAAVFSTWQSQRVGPINHASSISSICAHLSKDPDTQSLAPAEGWAPTKGTQWVIDRWASWPGMVAIANEGSSSNCTALAPVNSANLNLNLDLDLDIREADKVTSNCDLDARYTAPDTISWAWQYCTEWGFLQTGKPGPTQLVSSHNSLEYQLATCKRQFPDGTASGLLPAIPNANATNEAFGGWDVRPSNTFFTVGEYDPWRTLSLLSSGETWSPDIHSTVSPSACGVAGTADKVFGLVIKDAAHCYDLDSEGWGGEARGYFTTALKGWLGCFKKA